MYATVSQNQPLKSFFNSDITISGVSGTILQPTGNDDAWDIQFADGGSGATLDGFTLDFNGADDDRAGRSIVVSDADGPVVTNVTIQNNDITMGIGTGQATEGLEGVGIQTGRNADVSGLQILNNEFHGNPGVPSGSGGADSGAEGIYVNPGTVDPPVVITGNRFDGYLFAGISLEGPATVSDNEITTSHPETVNTYGIRVHH